MNINAINDLPTLSQRVFFRAWLYSSSTKVEDKLAFLKDVNSTKSDTPSTSQIHVARNLNSK